MKSPSKRPKSRVRTVHYRHRYGGGKNPGCCRNCPALVQRRAGRSASTNRPPAVVNGWGKSWFRTTRFGFGKPPAARSSPSRLSAALCRSLGSAPGRRGGRKTARRKAAAERELIIGCERSDIVIVEGAGGLLSPLGKEKYVADLARDLKIPLIVVAPNRIGIDQPDAANPAGRSGLRPGGCWHHSQRSPAAGCGRPQRAHSNPANSARWASAPLLARLPHNALELDTIVDWLALARPLKRRR